MEVVVPVICCPHGDIYSLIYSTHYNAIKVCPLDSARGFPLSTYHKSSHISPTVAIFAI